MSEFDLDARVTLGASGTGPRLTTEGGCSGLCHTGPTLCGTPISNIFVYGCGSPR